MDAGGGSGGPAPFLLKTYDMVDDSATDSIVSWSSSKNSFVVWNPTEFARLLLPTYFKHNNFSSFIRQLNTYGFRKIDPEKWEFANDEFLKDQKDLLKNIHRRKPIHSHSHPQGSLMNQERASFEEEIERLSREKAILQANILKFKQQPAQKLQLENIAKNVEAMAKRQENLLMFLEKAVQNPSFVEQLAQKVETMDFSAYNKKRRLPEVDHMQPVVKNNFTDKFSSSRSEFGNMFQQDFSNKLRLELSPTVSDVNLVSCSTQSSNDEGGSPLRHMSEELSAPARAESLHLTSETLDLSDSGTSFTLNMDSSSQRNASNKGNPNLHTLQESGTLIEDGESNVSFHLNLTLASSPLQVNISSISARVPQLSPEIGKTHESILNSIGKDSANIFCKNSNIIDEGNSPVPPPPPPVRVNDVFWEHFLTEKPGCSENEEASSNHRANPYSELDSERSGNGIYRTTKNIDKLSL